MQILSGGLFLGAIFMATDYTTSPLTNKGKFIYAVGCGILTVLIRTFGALPEGVSFSIIIMNILVPRQILTKLINISPHLVFCLQIFSTMCFTVFPMANVLQFAFLAPFADEAVHGVLIEPDLYGCRQICLAVEIVRHGCEELLVHSVPGGAFCGCACLHLSLRQVKKDLGIMLYEDIGY